MSKNDIDLAIAAISSGIDRACWTGVATDDPLKRHFIGEALLTAAAVFILHRYFAGFLKLGFNEYLSKDAQLTKK